MKKFFPLVAAGIMALALVTNADAARRFGGGASFGRPAPAQMAPAGTAQLPRELRPSGPGADGPGGYRSASS